jgi:hypothetical protein
MINDDRGLPRRWEIGDPLDQPFGPGSPDEPGFPVAPVPGKPHLKMIDGKWCVVVGPGGVGHWVAMPALTHAVKLNKKLNECPGQQ